MFAIFDNKTTHSILSKKYFVLPRTTVPASAVGETVDDITTVLPGSRREALVKFVRTYRQELEYKPPHQTLIASKPSTRATRERYSGYPSAQTL